MIRFDQRDAAGKTAPRIYANATHRCVGIYNVTVDTRNGDLVLGKYPNSTNSVVSITVAADETFAQRGIQCGGTGTSNVRVRCYDRTGTKIPANSPKLYGTYANLWITVVMWDGA